MRPELKVCGVNDPSFAVFAASAGVDYLGFIFHPSSPRAVTVEKALPIVASLRPDSKTQTPLTPKPKHPRLVGVFVKQSAGEIIDIMRRVSLDIVQLHRRATAEDVAALKAAGYEVWTLAGGVPGDGVLFDSSHGDGETVFRRGDYKSILAGRIGVANLAEALRLSPDVLDVNSTLETSPGVKSAALLTRLIEVFSLSCA